VENSVRKPRESVNFGLTRITSSTKNALKRERQLSGVDDGSTRRLPVAVTAPVPKMALKLPPRKAARLGNVACPYWLRAMFSLDWKR